MLWVDLFLNRFLDEVAAPQPATPEPFGTIRQSGRWRKEHTLIYPSPLKQDKSIGAPYVDLFRESQHKLLEPNSVIIVIGYSFCDNHVNDIIYRGLATNSSLNVVIINDVESKPVEKIKDKRIKADGLRPILTLDAWEHAYYLDCQNRRAAHLKEPWKIVDWKVVEEIAESKENQNILYYEANT